MCGTMGQLWHKNGNTLDFLFWTIFVQNVIIINWNDKYWNQFFSNMYKLVIGGEFSCTRIHMCRTMGKLQLKIGKSLGKNCSAQHMLNSSLLLIVMLIIETRYLGRRTSWPLRQIRHKTGEILGFFSWQIFFKVNGHQLRNLLLRLILCYFSIKRRKKFKSWTDNPCIF